MGACGRILAEKKKLCSDYNDLDGRNRAGAKGDISKFTTIIGYYNPAIMRSTEKFRKIQDLASTAKLVGHAGIIARVTSARQRVCQVSPLSDKERPA